MLFAQIQDEFPVDPDPNAPPPYPYPYDPLTDPWSFFLFSGAASVIWLLYGAVWLWMLIHCLRFEPERYIWFWVILFVPFGALIYLLVRWLPNNDVKPPRFVRRWTRGKELGRLESAALQIGNAHQFIQWGDALREVGQYEQAGAAYTKALQKEPKNPQALWGQSLVEMKHEKYPAAREHLAAILEIDPKYKFGDVSLEYGRALFHLNEVDAAREHLENHIRRWRHPEALYILARLDADQGDAAAARGHLLAMLLDINGSPRAIARKHGLWKSRARKLLRKLPR